jgi:hypothetical protein
MYRSTINFSKEKKRENQMKGIEISNGELYAVQQTTDKARINNNKKRILYIYIYFFSYCKIWTDKKK